MVDTFQALGVLLLALLPGALFTFAYEGRTAAWGVGSSDRILRLIGGSAAFQAVFAPATWQFYTHFIRTGRVSAGDLPGWVAFLPLAYVVLPWLLGLLAAAARPGPGGLFGWRPPRAWDELFVSGNAGWLRVRLKDPAGGVQGWLIGTIDRNTGTRPRGYAAGFPHAQDLYLSDTVELDPVTAAPRLDADGFPVLRRVGVLIRWDEIAYLESHWG